MQIFTTIVVAILATMIAMTLGISLLAVFGKAECLTFIDTDRLSLLPGIAIACGGMIAVLAFWRDRRHQMTERARKSDEIYLNLARDSFDEVFNLLKDKNNDRVVWVRASRLLLQAVQIKRKIVTIDIIEAFELAEERLRTELYRTLSTHVEGHKNRQALPPQFFYGIEGWDKETDLDNAAIIASSKIVVSEVTIDKNAPESISSELAVPSVIAIYNFLNFPESYNDPLDSVEEWDGKWSDSHGIDQGAKRYVAHAKDTVALNGRIIKKANK